MRRFLSIRLLRCGLVYVVGLVSELDAKRQDGLVGVGLVDGIEAVCLSQFVEGAVHLGDAVQHLGGFFLEGRDFEDVIRTAVSLGGDCDTLTCIAGSMAEAYYSVPDELVAACRDRLPEDMLTVLDLFDKKKLPRAPALHEPATAED